MDASTRRQPTLSDVAIAAGVSEITASRAMRGAKNVAQPTVERVEKAARGLGYVRNRLAGALAGQASNQVGVILPSLSNIVFLDVLKGLEDRLETAGFHPVLGISNYDKAREEHLVDSLLAWRPAGIVIGATEMTNRSRQLLREADLPVVEIMDIDCDPVDMAVGISHRQAGQAMGYYLMGRGYKRVGYVGHDLYVDQRAFARLEGFREALAQAGQEIHHCVTPDSPSSVVLGRSATQKLLAEMYPGPDLIYFSNDDMAVGGMFHCISEGISVPEDVALVGFNGLDIGQALPIPLTTTESRRELTGQTAADQIIARLTGESRNQKVDVGFSLIPGASA